MGIVEAHFSDIRIVIADFTTFAAQPIDDRQRRTLAHVVDVLFIRDAKEQHARTLHRFAIVVQAVRYELHHVFRHP